MSRGPIQKSLKYVPNATRSVKELARMITVPHKHPANDTFEPFWKFGRYVCQMKRLTINYCPQHPSSRGIRYFKCEPTLFYVFLCIVRFLFW